MAAGFFDSDRCWLSAWFCFILFFSFMTQTCVQYTELFCSKHSLQRHPRWTLKSETMRIEGQFGRTNNNSSNSNSNNSSSTTTIKCEKMYNLEQKFLERYNALMLDHIVSPKSRCHLSNMHSHWIWFTFSSVWLWHFCCMPFVRHVFKDGGYS